MLKNTLPSGKMSRNVVLNKKFSMESTTQIKRWKKPGF